MGASRRFFIAAVMALAFVHAPVAAQQLDPGDIVIAVTDAQTHAPIANASVFLLGGEQPVSSITNDQGRLEFDEVSPGEYSVSVSHAGYNRYDSRSFDVSPHSRVTVAIALAASIRTIANVTVRASAAISQQDLNANSAQRKISTSLSDALGKLAGVSIDDQLYGPDSGFDVSLNNHDASQTAMSIDGIRIAGPAGGMMNAAQNLFTGASVRLYADCGLHRRIGEFSDAATHKDLELRPS